MTRICKTTTTKTNTERPYLDVLTLKCKWVLLPGSRFFIPHLSWVLEGYAGSSDQQPNYVRSFIEKVSLVEYYFVYRTF